MSKPADNSVFYSSDLTIFPNSGQVEVQGEIVRLGLVNMQVLLVLLESDGAVASRADIIDRVWKNQTVSDDVLTRCISELRTQLGKHSSNGALIETLPKRGYRWVPVVSNNPIDADINPGAQNARSNNGWKRVLLLVAASLILLMLSTVSVLWLIESSLKTEPVRVALMPVQAAQLAQASMAADLDDMLKVQLLATNNLRFLARSAMDSNPHGDFSQLARDFHAKWVIEGNIRQRQNDFHVSLSLVDARTALVVYTMSQDLQNDSSGLDEMCALFLSEASQFMRMDLIE